MRRLRSLLFAALLLPLAVTATGCGEPQAKVNEPLHHSADGLAFDYPGNWKVSVERESIESIELVAVTTESKWGNALTIIQQFKPAVPIDYPTLLDQFIEGMKQSMVGALVEVHEVEGERAVPTHHALLGEEREGLRMRYTLSLAGESLDHTVDMFVATLDDRTIVVFTQVADEDRSKAEPGFEQVMKTLKLE